MGKKLANSFNNLDELKKASMEELMKLEGISDITARFIHGGIRQSERYEKLFKNGLKIIYPGKKDTQIANQRETQQVISLKIYVTGKVEEYTKVELQELLEKKGIAWGSGVTKSLDYLVLAEKPGKKRQEQADALGVKMIGWEEFYSKYVE